MTGSPIVKLAGTTADYGAAIFNAPRLAKAIVRRAVEHGWPDPTQLDAIALRSPSERSACTDPPTTT